MRFINIYMNVDNARKTYILKRRKYFVLKDFRLALTGAPLPRLRLNAPPHYRGLPLAVASDLARPPPPPPPYGFDSGFVAVSSIYFTGDGVGMPTATTGLGVDGELELRCSMGTATMCSL
uniref:Uncharacterized protein n=1 Tax=Oryza rufipogon TaxID=4529 RepID=A0A0E0QA57_ORYRU